jgi:hypothetical protein
VAGLKIEDRMSKEAARDVPTHNVFADRGDLDNKQERQYTPDLEQERLCLIPKDSSFLR